ncbi:PAS domain-containing protein [Methanolacinia petrolearia]|uniref:PAS domain-containing protein n=1 Tax=Methanolacinia petrolearia TaxID=54120 RepID=UPI003BA8C9D4
MENISDVLLTTDLDGKILFINKIIEKIYGYTPEEVIGMNIMNYIHPEDLLHARDILRKKDDEEPRRQYIHGIFQGRIGQVHKNEQDLHRS